MKIGTYQKSLDQVNVILRNFNFIKKFLKKNGEFSQEFKNCSRNNPYLKTYDVGINNFDYDFLLFDDSFFQFSRLEIDNEIVLRFAYYPNPILTIKYEDFLKNNNLSIEETGYLLLSDYEQEMAEAPEKEDYFLIRYDFSLNEYVEGIHSCSHIHIGYQESISFSTNKILTPQSFVLLVLKLCYYRLWKKMISDNKTCKNLYISIKEGLKNVSKSHWKNLDEKELFLS